MILQSKASLFALLAMYLIAETSLQKYNTKKLLLSENLTPQFQTKWQFGLHICVCKTMNKYVKASTVGVGEKRVYRDCEVGGVDVFLLPSTHGWARFM